MLVPGTGHVHRSVEWVRTRLSRKLIAWNASQTTQPVEPITLHLSFLLLFFSLFHIQSKIPIRFIILYSSSLIEGSLGLVCLRLHHRSPNWLPFPPSPCQPANWVSVRFSSSSSLPTMTLPQPGSAEKTIRKIDIAQVRTSLVKRNEGERPNFAITVVGRGWVLCLMQEHYCRIATATSCILGSCQEHFWLTG